MRNHLGFTKAQARHRSRMERSGKTRYPTDLMLEPRTHALQLGVCIGCSTEPLTRASCPTASPWRPASRLLMTCGAPIVNICGGEPTLYPELKDLVAGMIARKKSHDHVHECTSKLEDKASRSDTPHQTESVFDGALRRNYAKPTIMSPIAKGSSTRAVAMVRKRKEPSHVCSS